MILNNFYSINSIYYIKYKSKLLSSSSKVKCSYFILILYHFHIKMLNLNINHDYIIDYKNEILIMELLLFKKIHYLLFLLFF